jgi:hypothetical protein
MGRILGISSGRRNACLQSAAITGDLVGSSTVFGPPSPCRKRLHVSDTRTRSCRPRCWQTWVSSSSGRSRRALTALELSIDTACRCEFTEERDGVANERYRCLPIDDRAIYTYINELDTLLLATKTHTTTLSSF